MTCFIELKNFVVSIKMSSQKRILYDKIVNRQNIIPYCEIECPSVDINGNYFGQSPAIRCYKMLRDVGVDVILTDLERNIMTENLKYLLSSDSFVSSSQDSSGWTILHYMFYYSDLQFLDLIKTPRYYVKDSSGTVAFAMGKECRYIDGQLNALYSKYMESDLKFKTIIYDVFIHLLNEDIDDYYKNGDILIEKDYNGNTILHNVYLNGDIPTLHTLLSSSKEYDLNIQNNEGNTLFHLVCEKNDRSTLRILCKLGKSFDSNIKNNADKIAFDLLYE